MTKNIEDEQKYNLNATGIFLSTASTKVTIKKEIPSYNFVSFLSDIGGSLGMFLGFSFYKCGKRLIDFIPIGRFQFKKSLTKTSPNTCKPPPKHTRTQNMQSLSKSHQQTDNVTTALRCSKPLLHHFV